jgi:hypothetical protein
MVLITKNQDNSTVCTNFTRLPEEPKPEHWHHTKQFNNKVAITKTRTMESSSAAQFLA